MLNHSFVSGQAYNGFDKRKEGSNIELSRREFLKLSGAGAGGVAVLGLMKPGTGRAEALPGEIPLHKKVGETTTICPYCGAGCGFIVASENGTLVNIEGDPEHPINQGTACAKGGAQFQLSAHNPRRLRKVRYRAPGASEWEEKPWDWAIRRDFQKNQEYPRFKLAREGQGRLYSQQNRGHSLLGRSCAGQRGVLPPCQTDAGSWPGVYRTPGTYMTLLHCSGSGRVVRKRSNDQSLE